MDLWTQHMRRGDFPAAWSISDAVLHARRGTCCAHWPRHEQFIWNGEPIAGKRVLIRCYHGLGDTIQFIRYAALIRKQTREVIVWAQPALLGVLEGVEGVDRLLPLHDGAPEIPFDVDVESMELPHLCRSSLHDLPARVPYLRVPEMLSSPRTNHQNGNYRVGVVWQAGGWDPARSVPVPMLAALAEIPGVTLCALQRGLGLADWRDNYGPTVGDDDVTATARAMQTMDLIISVDSFPAHLAGALGRPVWTLLHAAPDWRWMVARTDSPWYPTMRLFRQARAGDWESVLAEVTGELRKFFAFGDKKRAAQTPAMTGFASSTTEAPLEEA